MKKLLTLMTVLFFLSAPNAYSQICNGDFDCDNDVDGTDAVNFKQSFWRKDCPGCLPFEDCQAWINENEYYICTGYDGLCPPELTKCGVTCVDPMTDRDYCGASEGCIGGIVCGAGEMCNSGTCELSCQSGLTDCSGMCVDTETNEGHCGGCSIPCESGEVCVEGNCEIYCSDNYAPVPKTGQTTCYDSAGNPRDCAGTGEDGEYQKGIATTPRFTDHGNGTVTDNLTGLMWIKDSQQICESYYVIWQVALDLCNDLDYASYDDWRLPNLRELESLVIWEHSPSLPIGHPFINQILFRFWSSTSKANTVSNYPDYAWTVDFTNGIREYGLKSHTFAYVRPVRGGH